MLNGLLLAVWIGSVFLMLSNGVVETPTDKALAEIRTYEYERGQNDMGFARTLKVGNCIALSEILQEELWEGGMDSRIIIGKAGTPHAWVEDEEGFWLEATTGKYVFKTQYYEPTIIGKWKSEING